MKKSNYIRQESDIHFKPLSEFNGEWRISDDKIELSKKLSENYGISEDKILHLIQYVEFAFLSDIPGIINNVVTDINQVQNFENDPQSIISIKFECKNKHFTITNPNTIDKIYSLLFNTMFEMTPNITKQKKKILSEVSIKRIATELYDELTKKYEISEWKSYCIIGFIFAFYEIGINFDHPIMTEQQYKNGSYLTYLSGNIKRYIIK